MSSFRCVVHDKCFYALSWMRKLFCKQIFNIKKTRVARILFLTILKERELQF